MNYREFIIRNYQESGNRWRRAGFQEHPRDLEDRAGEPREGATAEEIPKEGACARHFTRVWRGSCPTPSMKRQKQQVRLAQRDLDEAFQWLQNENVDTRPAVLKIVDIVIDLATYPLDMVTEALRKYAPDAMLIG